MKKIKKKTYIRFKAKPQPGYLLAVYSSLAEELQEMSYLQYKNREEELKIQGLWDEMEGLDIFIVSPLFQNEKIKVSRCNSIRDYSKFGNENDIEKYITCNSLSVFDRIEAMNLDHYFYINQDNNIIYRYITGSNTPTISLYQTKEGISYIYQPETGQLVEYPNIERLFLIESSKEYTIKEKKINKKTGVIEDLPDVYNIPTYTSIKTKRERVILLPSGGEMDDPTYPWGQIEQESKGLDYKISLSYHNAFFVELTEEGEPLTDLFGQQIPQPESILPLGKTSMVFMADEYGQQQLYLPDENNYLKFASQINGYETDIAIENDNFIPKQMYFNNGLPLKHYTYMDPIVFKSYTHQSYIIDKPDRSLIWKNGTEYLLPLSFSYSINNTVLPVPINSLRHDYVPQVACFAEYFACRHMLMSFLDETKTSIHGVNNIDEIPNIFEDTHYRISSWFGDFIYKIRVDEFIDGTFYYDELVKSNYSSTFLVQANKRIKRDLKIYHPDTKDLWVEKYQTVFNEDLMTAEIKYISRFKISFFPPITQVFEPMEMLEEASSHAFTSLKQIMYLPSEILD